MKRIIINLLIIILLFLSLDYCYFLVIKNDYVKKCIAQNQTVDSNIKYKTYYIEKDDDTTTTYAYKNFIEKKLYNRPIIPSHYDNKKAPILLFGCSYTWLNNTEGLQKLLAEYTNRPVFNFAFWAWGAQHMLYLIDNPLLYIAISEEQKELLGENNIKIPEYAIYTYINEHKLRLGEIVDFFTDIEPNLQYKYINDKLVIVKNSLFKRILFRFFTYRYLKYKYINKFDTDDEKKYQMVQDIILKSYHDIKEKYPNIKFIMLDYSQSDEEYEREKTMFKNLENNGIIIISTKELTTRNLLDSDLTEDDGYHPNVKAWQIITPAFAKKIEEF